MRRKTTAEKLAEERERRNDLDFMEEVRQASPQDLSRMTLNLSYGGPEWQKVAVRRALARMAAQ